MTSLTRLTWTLHRRTTAQLRREYLERRNLPRTLGNRTCMRAIAGELVRRAGS